MVADNNEAERQQLEEIKSFRFALAKTKYSNPFETLFLFSVLESKKIFSKLFIYLTGMGLKPVLAVPRNERCCSEVTHVFLPRPELQNLKIASKKMSKNVFAG